MALPLRALGSSAAEFDRMVGWANILGSCAAAAGFVLLVVARWVSAARPSRQVIDEAADRLAGMVLRQEGQQRARLLSAHRVTTAAANVHFEARQLVRFQEAGSARVGNLKGIGRFFGDETDGRLVILGSPGAGKTALAMELLIQLLEQRGRLTDAQERAMCPVPVRFSLPSWNTHQPMTDWLVHELAARFGLAGTVARAMVDNWRVLPILDGLDEMDSEHETPERANAAIAQLNTYLAGRTGLPLVVTCRSQEYQRLTEGVRPATEITIQSLTERQIRDYLDHEYQDPRDSAGRRQWQQVLAELAGQRGKRILDALATPWRLTLAVTYQRYGGDLVNLLTPPNKSALPPGTGQASTTTAIDHEDWRRVSAALLEAFIPGRTRVYGGSRYTPEQVDQWCQTIAQHLNERVDIVLHEWWPIAGAERVLRWHARIVATIAITSVLVAGVADSGGIGAGIDNILTYLREFPYLPRAYLRRGLIFTILLTVFPYLTVRQARRYDVTPAKINTQQLRSHRGRRMLAAMLAAGLVFGLVVGLTLGLVGEIAAGLAVGLTVGLAFGLTFGLEPIKEVDIDPRDPLRNDLIVWLTCGLLTGLGGLAVGLAGVLAFGPVLWLMTGLAGHAWLRYAIATVLATKHKHLPWRFARFLHWAHQAGILRTAGKAYQFRHIEIRNWLQDHTQARPTAVERKAP